MKENGQPDRQLLYLAEVDERKFQIGEQDIHDLDCIKIDATTFHILNDTKSRSLRLIYADPRRKQYTFEAEGKTIIVQLRNQTEIQVERMGLRSDLGLYVKEIDAPMPGRVLAVSVKPGDVVVTGQPLLILEAMKMENVIISPRDGTISSLHASAGDTVDKKQKLVSFQ